MGNEWIIGWTEESWRNFVFTSGYPTSTRVKVFSSPASPPANRARCPGPLSAREFCRPPTSSTDTAACRTEWPANDGKRIERWEKQLYSDELRGASLMRWWWRDSKEPPPPPLIFQVHRIRVNERINKLISRPFGEGSFCMFTFEFLFSFYGQAPTDVCQILLA